MTRKLLVLAAALAGISLQLQASELAISATLEPRQIQLGQAARLQVTVSGGKARGVEPPVVDGLEFNAVGQSSNFQYINGAMSSSVSKVYEVVPSRTGTYTIPSFGPDNSDARTQPLTLQVVDGAAPSAALPAPQVNTASGTSASVPEGANEMAFLKLVLPKTDLVVGERVPVRVEAWFHQGLRGSLNDVPSMSVQSFTLESLRKQPQQHIESIGGRPYTVLTWDTALTAVKAGEDALELNLPITVAVETQAQRPAGMPEEFDDIFANFFGRNRVTTKQIELKSQPIEVKVADLPEEGRPADFSGGVGEFTVSASVSPDTMEAGDPVTVRLQVKGKGNFSRLQVPMLEAGRDFKAYAASERFESSDSVDYSGVKTFEQAVVPTSPGKLELPAIKVSTYDPEKKQYVTQLAGPFLLDVNGTAVPSRTMASTTGSAGSVPVAVAGDASGPADLYVSPGSFHTSLRPLLANPVYLGCQAIPVLGLAAALLLAMRRRKADPMAGALQRGEVEARRRMDEALKAGDAAAFFAQAREMCRQVLGRRWGLRPETITLAELERHAPAVSENLKEVFRQADVAMYSGEGLASGDLGAWRETVLNELKQWEKTK